MLYKKGETRGTVIRSVAGDVSMGEIRLGSGKSELFGVMGNFYVLMLW